MTEDTDERMERAERIRQLREGGGNESPAEARGDAEAADSSTEAGTEPIPDSADVDTEVAATGGASAGEARAAIPGAAAGVEVPDRTEMEAALEQSDAAGVEDDAADDPAVGRGARGEASTTANDVRTRVLEFVLGEELYCLDIAGVEEIVTRETVKRVPNTPGYVQGVVDLRGQITTILDTKGLLEVDADGPGELIVVFAPAAYEEQGAVGWIVDEVRQVGPVNDDQVRELPTDDDFVEGVVDREDADELVVWVRPEVAMAGAVGGGQGEDQ